MTFPSRPDRKTSRPVTQSRPSRFRPYVELLERRDLLSNTYTVINTNDAGDGSLRWAITQANQDFAHDQIYFNIPGGGVQTITLQSALPKITAPVIIDGYGQGTSTLHNLATPNTLGADQGTNANLSVQLTGASSVTVGLDVGIGGSETVIRGLSIFGFSKAGISIETFLGEVKVLGNF